MNLKKLSLEELESMSYIDIAYNILKKEKHPKTTLEILEEIEKLLKSEEFNKEKLIGDFYTSLVVDKRFVLLKGKWQLKENSKDEEIENRDIDENDDIDIIEEIDEEEIEEEVDEDDEIVDEEIEEEEEEISFGEDEDEDEE